MALLDTDTIIKNKSKEKDLLFYKDEVKTFQLEKKSKYKLFQYSADTSSESWKNSLITAIKKYDINYALKKMIIKHLNVHFFKFLNHKNNRILNYTDFLLSINPRLESKKVRTMCQSKDLKREFTDIPNNNRGGGGNKIPKKKYNLNGSGVPNRFCVNGSRSIMKVESKKVTHHFRGVPVKKTDVVFELKIKIFGG